MNVTFLGHKNTPNHIQKKLEQILIDLIVNKDVRIFYVGNQGNFDVIVHNTIKILQMDYPYIKCFTVLAYRPKNHNNFNYQDYTDTIYPEILTNAPPRFAISKRNEWMIERSDFVVTYTAYSQGGAGKFQDIAEKKGKTIISLKS